MFLYCFCFFKQKTAYEMRISDWSSDVCSSDLGRGAGTTGRSGAVVALLPTRPPITGARPSRFASPVRPRHDERGTTTRSRSVEIGRDRSRSVDLTTVVWTSFVLRDPFLVLDQQKDRKSTRLNSSH